MRKTIVIFGASSFVGSNLVEQLKDEFRIIGTYYETRTKFDNVLTLPCDVLNRDQVQMILFTFRPDYTIYAIGLLSIENCYRHPKLADALNTVGVFNVTEYSERYKSKMILLSTSFVFNGDKREFLENDTPDPSTMYGKTKVAAEFFIQKSCLNYLIFRVCNLYGRSYNPRQRKFIEMLEYKLSQDEPVRLDTQVAKGWLDVTYLAMILRLCFQHNLTNRLFQISSRDVKSHYQLGMEYAEVFNLNKALITKATWPFYHMEGHVGSQNGLFYSMDVFNIESFLGIEMPSVSESIKYTFERLGGGKSNSKVVKKGPGINYI